MKAMTQDHYGSSDVLRLGEISTPAFTADEGLVRVHAAGVAPEVWHVMTGRPYFVRLMGFGVRAPKQRVPGRDLAGTVEAVGSAATELRPGDEVFGSGRGTLAEYACSAAADVARSAAPECSRPSPPTSRSSRRRRSRPRGRPRFRAFATRVGSAVDSPCIEDGKLTPVIDRTFALGDAAQALTDAEEGHREWQEGNRGEVTPTRQSKNLRE